mmetsp:Transcript_51139/g.119830  ORF Transcript_51139/g.119830 Transcript_51139/m.119830 type:complete len:796 (+) Transcript_51139:97-2484(+)
MSFSWLQCCCSKSGSDDKELTKLVPSSQALGQASLFDAAREGDSELVRKLLLSGMDPNTVDPVSTPRSRSITPLIVAARAGHASVVKVLVQDPTIDVNAFTMDEVREARTRQTALHWAAREGHADVVQALLSHPFIDPNMKTAYGFTAAMVAAQNGFVDTLSEMTRDPRVDLQHVLSTPDNVDLTALMVATVEGHGAVVKHLASLKRDDKQDINGLSRSFKCRNTPIHFAAEQAHPYIVEALLQARADPDIPSDRGTTTLEVAIEVDNTEMIMLLLAAGAGSDGVFSNVHRAQVDGNAQRLRELYAAETATPTDRSLMIPGLHRAVLDDNQDLLVAEISRAPGRVTKILDGGNMPAAYWAIELGQWHNVRLLLEKGHALPVPFVEKLLTGEFGHIAEEKSSYPGERAFEVLKAMLAKEAHVVYTDTLAQGAFALFKPFCGSVAALNYFKRKPAAFDHLRDLCNAQIKGIYRRIDNEVTAHVLKDLGAVASGEGTESRRQDEPGLVPELKYFLDEEKSITMGGNHELFVARSLAIAALAANEVFTQDMHTLFGNINVTVVEAPPKGYTRMFNKLQNPAEHGDPSIPKPRPMKNVDVLRVAIVVKDPADVERTYLLLKSRYRVLRVKNNHDPAHGEGFGGYRSLLVNFAYDSGVRIRDAFGHGYYGQSGKSMAFTMDRNHVAVDATAEKWHRYCRSMRPTSDWLWGMQGLWRVGRRDPYRRLVLAAEVQVVLAAYMQGRSLSHMLYKISRCETGPSEMARDFSPGFVQKTPEMARALADVMSIVKQQRSMKEERYEL